MGGQWLSCKLNNLPANISRCVIDWQTDRLTEWLVELHVHKNFGLSFGFIHVLTFWHMFLVANKRLYIRVCPSVGPSVRRSVSPSVGPSVVPSRVFFNHRIQAKQRSNFHQCPCPTFATDAAVYTALLVVYTWLCKSLCLSVGPLVRQSYIPLFYTLSLF